MAISTAHSGTSNPPTDSAQAIPGPAPLDVSNSDDVKAELALGVSRSIIRSQAAFRRDLPRLLSERPGQWVAYHGDDAIGFGPTKTDIYRECIRRGLKQNEFLVRSIEPEIDVMTVGPGNLA